MSSPLFLYLLSAIVLIPVTASVLIVLFGKDHESLVSRIASISAGSLLLANLGLLVAWANAGFPSIEIPITTLYKTPEYEFPIVLFFDHVSAVFLAVTALVSASIVKFCRYYLHREEGFARFFRTIFLFIAGMNFLLMAGTLDNLFAAWEIVGLSSFLLIGFYRHRVQPARNALRALVVYRVCDIGLLLGALMGHLVWHGSHHLSALQSMVDPEVLSHVGQLPLLGMSLLILLAAAGKSAQFPFCFWLPKAMEGPTPSSAIFYGALSVHAGVFLLMRTMPLWQASHSARIAIGAVGLMSAFIATLSGRTQSNIKGQVAYASITQVGLMLVELALGLEWLALAHFVSNSFLRCYQLLVSPSVVAYLLRVQGSVDSRFAVSDWSMERLLPPRMRTSLYVFSLNEGYLEQALYRGIWVPFARIGRFFKLFRLTSVRVVVGLFGLTIVLMYVFKGTEKPAPVMALPLVLIMLMASFNAVAEKRSLYRAWNAIGFSVLMGAGAVLVGSPAVLHDILIYLSGVVPSWFVGLLAVHRLSSNRKLDLTHYYGLVENEPVASFILLVAFLGLSGFPISPAFVGEDLLLHHAVHAGLWLPALLTLALVINGVTLARLYTRACLGGSTR